jgi:hypothetical protein
MGEPFGLFADGPQLAVNFIAQNLRIGFRRWGDSANSCFYLRFRETM